MTAQKAKTSNVPSVEESDKKSASGADLSGGGNVEKIRDILFGSQMRDYERKFNRLEERILKEVTRLKEETTRRIDTVESFFNKELESLAGRLKTEQAERTETYKELSSDHNKTTKSIEKKIAELEDLLGRNTRELRQQLLDQSKTLSDDISKKYDETTDALDRSASELREEKVDRSTLSELLTEIALRLANDPLLDLDKENL